MNRKITTLAWVLTFVLGFFLRWEAAAAQNITPHDVLAAVNNLRASYGLAPYEADSSLMSYAQQHSEYQASTGVSTHTHSDGNSPSAYGVTENIASGTASFMTLDFVIYQIWADSVHMNTMVGYESGSAGVGIATAGGDIYITLDVRPGNRASVSPPGGAGENGSLPVGITPIALVPLVTATPGTNGSIVHLVGYGQSLWSIAIAYDVKIDEIRTLNGLAAGTTDIYAGQKLVIHPAGFSVPAASTAQATSSEQAEPLTPSPAVRASPTAAQSSPTAGMPTPQSSPSSPALPAALPQAAPPASPAGFPLQKALAVLLIVVGMAGVAWVVRKGFASSEA